MLTCAQETNKHSRVVLAAPLVAADGAVALAHSRAGAAAGSGHATHGLVCVFERVCRRVCV